MLVLGWGSLFTVLVLMFVVRPINAGLCTWNSGLNDTDPAAIQQAEQSNLRIIVSSALDTGVLEEAGLASMELFLP